jgi:hypothetical protein
VPVAFFLNMVEQLLPIFGLFLLVGMLIFILRYFWRALLNPPFGGGAKPWVFFGNLWLIIYMGFFLYAVVGTGGDFSVLPAWFGALFVHSGFVGMMTNLIMAVISSRAQEGAKLMSWGEPLALWTINLGLLAFAGLKIAADIRLGAMVMGIGILLAVFTMLRRLSAS